MSHKNLGYAIADGLRGALGRLLRRDREQAALWLFVDHVLLMFQSPVYVSLGRRIESGVSLVEFSSLSPQDRKYLGLSPQEAEFLDESFQDRLMVNHGDLIVSVRCLPMDDAERARRVPIGIDDAQDTIKGMLEEHHDTILLALNRYDRAAHLREISSLRNGDTDLVVDSEEHFRPIRERIAAVLDSIGRTPLTEAKGSDNEGLNLFAVVRRPTLKRVVEPPPGKWDRARETAEYNYTAGLVLSNWQRRWCEKEGVDPNEIEMPLSSDIRSIADTPLTQGVIDFSLPNERIGNPTWSRQHYKAEEKRGDIEGILYRMAFPLNQEPSGAEGVDVENIVYIPIHVGGTPWLALFTFNKGEPSQESKMRNYLIYRDLIPILSEGISLALQGAYAEALADCAVSEFIAHYGLASFMEPVNSAWRVRSLFYPYSRFFLSSYGDPEEKLQVEASDLGFPIYMVEEQVERQLPYRLLDRTQIRRTVEQRLQRAADFLRGQYKDALFVFGHHAGKLFQESGLPGLKVKGDPKLAVMKNRLYAAWGMSAAIRPLKQPGAGLPVDWFPESRRQKPFPSIAEIIVSIHAVCRFFISGIAVDLDPAWTIKWKVESQDEREETFGDLMKVISVEAPRLLPFDGDSSPVSPGTLALTLGLAESIRNARTHLHLSKRDFRRGVSLGKISRCVMTIDIRCDEGGGLCSVVVGGVHVAGGDPYSRTISHIQHLERTALVSRGQPVVASGQAVVTANIDGHFDWVESLWKYFYGRIILPEKSYEGSKGQKAQGAYRT